MKTNLFSAPRSLKKNIIVGACLFSLFISVVFSSLNFFMVYMMEDNFFKRLLSEEKIYMQAIFIEAEKKGLAEPTVVPRQSFMYIYNSVEELPNDLAIAYKKHPKQNEYKGEDGRHYHLTHLKAQKKILSAEVSSYLIVRSAIGDIFIMLFFVSVFMFATALYLGYMLANRATAPLTQLVQLLTNTSPEKLPTNFSKDYPENEIGLLATTLEQAMARISQFIHREQHFTRDTSHELRTPVTIIKNAIELIEQQSLNADEKTLIARIALANNQMEQTIATLLSLAREGKDNNTADASPLLPAIEQAIIDQSYLLNNKSIELDIQVDGLIQVRCKLTVLQILLNNLLSNAFQYTEKGLITIAYKDNTLSLNDSGGGIDKSIHASAMDSLVKGKKSQGFGIGLSLVKRLCETYQLDLTLTSTQEGLCVAIYFPST